MIHQFVLIKPGEVPTTVEVQDAGVTSGESQNQQAILVALTAINQNLATLNQIMMSILDEMISPTEHV